jgi:hemolysin III
MEVSVKPRLRGVSHQWAALAFLALGALLVALASGATERLAASVFAGALVASFGASAVYHRVDWRSVRARRWMRRLDHAMIYVLIAGTYTPFALLALEGAWRTTILAVVWSGAAAAVLFKLVWVDAPKWVGATIGIALGWAGVAAIPKLIATVGIPGVVLLGIGGALYMYGAVAYARQRPDPVPAVFGYHEVFHACTIGAAACQFSVVARLVAS